MLGPIHRLVSTGFWVCGICFVCSPVVSAATLAPWLPVYLVAGADKTEATAPVSGKGLVDISVANAVGKPLAAKVEFRLVAGGAPIVAPVREGKTEGRCPVGAYDAYTYVYSRGLPFLVDVQRVEIKEDAPVMLTVTVVEGSRDDSYLAQFDKDSDLALDRVEIVAGTDPGNPSSIPGRQPVPSSPAQVIDKEIGWYKGELHAHSEFGGGSESVAAVIKRAEDLRLDFLAIADLNTMKSVTDPGFHSDSVVLIPAMEWGDSQHGIGLIYGPGTVPAGVANTADAQGVVWLVQVQGGAFAIAHPCFAIGPWQWGLSQVNAVEVWCREYRKVPPISLETLSDFYRQRVSGRLIYPIARAAATTMLSANGQATLFWNYQLENGLYAAAIGGSMTSSPKVPMARPVTHVYAEEKSLRGILDGIRRGRTYVTASVDGPTVDLTADVRKDGIIDLNIGGIMPVGVETQLELTVKGAKGKKAQVMADGKPIQTKLIEGDGFVMRFPILPDRRIAYWARVIDGGAEEKAFGDVDVYAITSPIYAHDMIFIDKNVKPEDARIRIERQQPAGGFATAPAGDSAGTGAPLWQAPESGGKEIIPTWRY